uniref:hypothetical protein n=1 Tax=Lachnoclostridium phocaeense TaxID=1871021 RepID=UPI0026DA8AFE|nr:hypothetical protein [Lachnoclostridium phocaeense]
MTLKDFKPGQMAYILYMKKGYNAEPILFVRKVVKVGRKYITDDRGCRFYESDVILSADRRTHVFLEDCEFGEKGFLFTSKKEADDWIELHELEKWLITIRCCNHPYTIEQLRKVKEILEPDT